MQPRLSAGIVLYRIGPSSECEVYWVRRSKSLRFMGGWNAFPGGRLSADDATVPVYGTLGGEDAYLSSGERAAHPACALRELFEEAGVLAAVGSLPNESKLDRARGRLLADELNFAAWLENCGLALDASRLIFAGRWVTPPLSKIRFDATFFLLEWPASASRQPSVIPGELSSGEWTSARSALARWEAGEVFLAQPTLETLRVLAEYGPEGTRRLWRSQAHQPNSPHSIEFRPLIRVIPLAARTLPPATHTNTLLIGGRDMILIDPGSPWDSELRRLREIVKAESRRTGGRLRGIWLSHHHEDHVAGAEKLRRHYGVSVSSHAATASRLSRAGIRIDGRLRDGELVELAGTHPLRVRVLHTPGHASGHLCFLEERTRTLLGGDMVSGYSSVVINPPDGSMAEYLDSLERLLDLNPQVILPSHGSMIPEARKALRKARRHRLWREERVLEAWKGGERDPERMLGPVYGDLHPLAQPIAVRQLLAHLERLEAIGRIRSLTAELRSQIGRRDTRSAT